MDITLTEHFLSILVVFLLNNRELLMVISWSELIGYLEVLVNSISVLFKQDHYKDNKKDIRVI